MKTKTNNNEQKRIMRNPKDSYLCPRCGYVLPKRDAVVSGWDAEGSSTHVHCPRCGKIIARYVEQERRNSLELDRIDKILFTLPFLTLADTMSTEVSLMFGGMEGGPIAGPIYEQYGQPGLIALTFFAFVVSLGCVWFLRYAKTRIKQGERSKLNRVAMAYAILFFFLLEAYIMGVVVQNLLVPLKFPSLTLFAIQY
jgi:ribosomal protein S27AE